jgi:enoyl-CoA hydratase/carnithine racemase
VARVDVPASDLAWPLLHAAVRRLTGATRVLVVRIVAASNDVPPGATEDAAVYRGAPEWLARPDLVSIAAITTPVSGAALALTLRCDFRILADDVTLDAAGADFLGGVGLLVDLVGRARALELCLTGRRISASEAVAAGLATVAVARDQVDDAVADLIAAVLATPRSLATEVKALVSSSTDSVGAGRLAAEYAASERLARDDV